MYLVHHDPDGPENWGGGVMGGHTRPATTQTAGYTGPQQRRRGAAFNSLSSCPEI